MIEGCSNGWKRTTFLHGWFSLRSQSSNGGGGSSTSGKNGGRKSLICASVQSELEIAFNALLAKLLSLANWRKGGPSGDLEWSSSLPRPQSVSLRSDEKVVLRDKPKESLRGECYETESGMKNTNLIERWTEERKKQRMRRKDQVPRKKKK